MSFNTHIKQICLGLLSCVCTNKTKMIETSCLRMMLKSLQLMQNAAAEVLNRTVLSHRDRGIPISYLMNNIGETTVTAFLVGMCSYETV